MNITNTVLSSSERIAVFSYVINNGNVGIKFVTDYLEDNYEVVDTVYVILTTIDTFLAILLCSRVSVSLVVVITGARITTVEQLNEVDSYYKM